VGFKLLKRMLIRCSDLMPFRLLFRTCGSIMIFVVAAMALPCAIPFQSYLNRLKARSFSREASLLYANIFSAADSSHSNVLTKGWVISGIGVTATVICCVVHAFSGLSRTNAAMCATQVLLCEQHNLAQQIQAQEDGKARPRHRDSSIKIETVAPDQLSVVARWDEDSLGQRAMRFDVDNDGTPETIVYAGLFIEIVQKDRLRRLRLITPFDDNYQITELIPLRIEAKMCWFASIMSLEAVSNNTIVGLFDDTGRELWRFTAPNSATPLNVGESVDAQPKIAAADLDGDKDNEFIILAQYIHWLKGDEMSRSGDVAAAYLFILDSDGTIKSQTYVSDAAYFALVVEPTGNDDVATIQCGSNIGLVEFRLAPPSTNGD
jgi:hypothetical protein